MMQQQSESVFPCVVHTEQDCCEPAPKQAHSCWILTLGSPMLSTSGELGTSLSCGDHQGSHFPGEALRDTGGKDSAQHHVVTRGAAPRYLLYDQ